MIAKSPECWMCGHRIGAELSMCPPLFHVQRNRSRCTDKDACDQRAAKNLAKARIGGGK